MHRPFSSSSSTKQRAQIRQHALHTIRALRRTLVPIVRAHAARVAVVRHRARVRVLTDRAPIVCRQTRLTPLVLRRARHARARSSREPLAERVIELAVRRAEGRDRLACLAGHHPRRSGITLLQDACAVERCRYGVVERRDRAVEGYEEGCVVVGHETEGREDRGFAHSAGEGNRGQR